MGFQTYSSFMSHALGNKCQTSLLSDVDASSEGDLSLCGERGDSPGPLSTQGSLNSDSRAEDRSNGPPSPTLESHKGIRQRTAQACDKCRERKTKCSGNRPECNRCGSRGLICEYSVRESRVRTPIRVRAQPPMSSPNPLQVNYHDTIRPTPACHSRMGHGQSRAFAPTSHPRTVSHSPAPSSSSYSSGISLERDARLNAFHDEPIPLGLGLGISTGGRLTAARSKCGMSTWDMRSDTLRPQSAPVTPQYLTNPGVSSHGFKMEANVPQVQDLGEGSTALYGYDYTGRETHMVVPPIRVQEDSPYRRSPLGGSTDTVWDHQSHHDSLAVPRPPHDGRPASMPTMPLAPPNDQLCPKAYESYYDLPPYRPNLASFEDWTGPSSMGSDEPLPEATSILAAHYNRLGSASFDNLSFGTHERTTNSAALGPPLHQVGSLEVMCPAPLLPIGSGVFGLPSSSYPSTGKPTVSYDAHDASQQQQQQDPNLDAMFLHFPYDHTSRDVGGVNTHTHNIEQPHPLGAGSQIQHPDNVTFNDFNGYGFF